ncbi:helix-turn-helix domain-containing protein [Lactococcus garvieae]|uniref:helix-turn-helix domain-containing protein n=1 Tax=Lactococcus garvieae TaxID=1363 RepID=UPI00254DE7B7|nr:helix-turn-helix transcriptional regulator [Lactococcus garvieae]
MGTEYFSIRLKSLRKSKKLSQADLAKKVGKTTWAISSYEQGKSYPSIDVLIKLCSIFDVSSDYLIGISDDLHIKLGLIGLNDEETQLILQFVNLVEQNRRSDSTN